MGTRVFIVGGRQMIGPGITELLILEHENDLPNETVTMETALANDVARCLDVMVIEVAAFDRGEVEQGQHRTGEFEQPRCLMVTSSADHTALIDAIMAGCAGSVLQRALAELGPVPRVAYEKPAWQIDQVRGLTKQERLILELIGEGLTNREIAEHMRLKEKTIKNYVTQVFAKLGMKRRTQAAILATELRRP